MFKFRALVLTLLVLFSAGCANAQTTQRFRLLRTSGSPPPGPVQPTVDMDMVAQTFTGGSSMSNVNSTLGALGTYGLPSSATHTFIVPKSMDTSASPWNSSGAGISSLGTVTSAGGFKINQIQCLGYGTVWQTTSPVATRPAGAIDVVKIRIGAIPGGSTSGGYRVYIDADGSNFANSGNLAAPPISQSSNVTVLSAVTGSEVIGGVTHTYQDISAQIIRSGGTNPGVNFNCYSAGNFEVWGVQTVENTDADVPFTATSTTALTVAGSTYTTSGALDTALSGTSGAIVVTTQDLASIPGFSLYTNGATGIENALLTGTDYSTLQDYAGTNIAPGISAFKGISLVGISWTPTSYTVSYNGGTVQHESTGPPSGAVRRLLYNVDGQLRRVQAWNVALSDSDLTYWTSLTNRTFAAPGLSLVPGVTTQTFNDDFTTLPLTDIIRSRNGCPCATFPAVNNVTTTQQYLSPAGTQGPNGRAMWMPRYPFDSSATGSGTCCQINGEYECYCVQEYTWTTGGLPNNYSKVSGTNALRIEGLEVSLFAAGVQAQIPTRAGGGGTLPYTTGVLTTGGTFQQLFGIFEIRATFPAQDVDWPAFWMTPGSTVGYNSQAEIDWIEIFGQHGTGQTNRTCGCGSVHANAYNYNNTINNLDSGINLSSGVHVITGVWRSGFIAWYLEGKQFGQTFSYSAGNACGGGVGSCNIDAAPMFLEFNYAIGYGGAPSGGRNGAASGMRYDVYQVHAWQ